MPMQTRLSGARDDRDTSKQLELDIGNLCSSVNRSPRMAHWLKLCEPLPPKARHMTVSFSPLSPPSAQSLHKTMPRGYIQAII